MKKTIFILLGFSLLILIIWALANWQISNLTDFSNIESLKRAIPKFQEISSSKIFGSTEEKVQYQEFADPDGGLKIKYPSSWLKMDEEENLTSLTPQEWAKEYNLRALFLAQGFRDGKFAQLIVYRGTFEISVEEILKKMIDDNKKNGWQIEITGSDIKENEGIFDLRSGNADNSFFLSKEKILSAGKEAYIVSFIAPEKDWLNWEKEASTTINSVLLSTEL